MPAQARSLVRRVREWPPVAWLLGLGLVLLIRFPVKFLLQPPFLMDFEVYRFTALRVLQGEAVHLYAPTTSERMVFKYAPCWAVLLAPLGWLSTHAGAVLWSALNVLWVGLTCWCADRLARTIGLKPPAFLAVPAVLLLVRPITSQFLLGQSDLLWGFLVTAWLWCEASRRSWWSALALALAISLKLPAALGLAYLILRGRWRSAARTLLCLAATNMAAAWLLLPSHPWSLFASWRHALFTSGLTYAFDISNQSLLALAGRLLRDDGYGLNILALPDPVVMAVAAAVQLVLFARLLMPHRAAPSDATTRLVFDGALLLIFMVLFSPSGWLAAYSSLLVPVFLALALFADRPRATCPPPRPAQSWSRGGRQAHSAGRGRRWPLAAGAALTLGFSALTHSKFWRAIGVTHLSGESYVYLVLMILPCFGLSLAWYLWHHRQASD